jgi:tetratricopeptide (TPR) repeat protein
MDSDVMQSDGFWKAYAWVDKNRKQVAWGAAIAVGLGLVVVFVLWQQREKAVAAGEAFSAVAVPQLMGPPSATSPDAYLKVATDYPQSAAGANAVLLAAGGYYVQGKYDEAKAQFERFQRDYAGSPLSGQARLGVAACLDAQGKTNEATAAYKDLVDRHPNESVIPQAKFALARLYEAQGKFEQAKVLFEDVARNPMGSIGSEAGIRLEELMQQHPELAPKPATPVTPTAVPVPPTPPPARALTNTPTATDAPATTKAPAAEKKP